MDALRTTAEPLGIRDTAFCTVKKTPFILMLTMSSNTGSVTWSKGEEFRHAGVYEKGVDAPEAFADLLHGGFDIRQPAGVGLNGEDSVADLLCGGLQTLFAASGNGDLRAFPCVGFCDAQANSTAAAGDYGNFALKSSCAHEAPSPDRTFTYASEPLGARRRSRRWTQINADWKELNSGHTEGGRVYCPGFA